MSEPGLDVVKNITISEDKIPIDNIDDPLITTSINNNNTKSYQGESCRSEEQDGFEQQTILDALNKDNHSLRQKLSENELYLQKLNEKCLQLEMKLENESKKTELMKKEKDSMVIKYAVGEKNLLEQKSLKEQLEKKYKEQLCENEIAHHKVHVMGTEKNRICQMLDNKCHEYKTSQQELEQAKTDLNALENKLKWSQNSLKTELQQHKDCQSNLDLYKTKLQDARSEIEKLRQESQETMKNFYSSQENRAHVLDQQCKEQQAHLILSKHEKNDREHQIKSLSHQLETLQTKKIEMLEENNELSLRVQQLERDRLENEQKLSNLRSCADQQRQDSADLQAKNALVDQYKLQLNNERENLKVANEQIELLKQRNAELDFDMGICREREAEMLLFTQQLTEKNVKLQSEFTAMETKVQQLSCEHNLMKRANKEHETKNEIVLAQNVKEKLKMRSDIERLEKSLLENCNLCDKLRQEVADQKGDNILLKRKYELSLKEMNKELQQSRKKLENYESMSNSSSSSNSSLSANLAAQDQVKVIQPDGGLDRQSLIEHIVKLQRISAKKSEKLDFLEEHVNTLVLELQKKTRLLQTYILRDQSGTMTSNTMDNNKANIAKLNGIMASVYSSKVVDTNLSMELLLDINRKLQAVLEDALLKNITLKENVDTLGEEIDRLNKTIKNSI